MSIPSCFAYQSTNESETESEETASSDSGSESSDSDDTLVGDNDMPLPKKQQPTKPKPDENASQSIAKRGPGRPPGARNKKTIARELAAVSRLKSGSSNQRDNSSAAANTKSAPLLRSRVSTHSGSGKSQFSSPFSKQLRLHRSGQHRSKSRVLTNGRGDRSAGREETADVPSLLVQKETAKSNDVESDATSPSEMLVDPPAFDASDDRNSGSVSPSDEGEDADDEYEFWQPPAFLHKTLDAVTITDVTTDSLTITFRECRQREGFFKLDC